MRISAATTRSWVGSTHKTKHGKIQHYTHGRMYWTKKTGARYLTGHVLHVLCRLRHRAYHLPLRHLIHGIDVVYPFHAVLIALVHRVHP